MKNFTSNEERFVFSENLQKVYDDMKARLRPHGAREGTWTGAEEPDGKTPFLDAFDQYDEYEIALAHGIANSWVQSDPHIYPGEILVGINRPFRPIREHFSFGLSADDGVLKDNPAYADRVEENLARFEKHRDRFVPADFGNMQRRHRDIFGFWPHESAFAGLWWTGGYQGHTVPYYQKLLDLGLDGLLEEIDESAKVNGNNVVLRACRIIVEGLSQFAINYADEAARLAAEAEGEDRERLLKVSEVCRNVSHKAPATLHEACQLMWFYCLWDWVDCIGRYDQYMYPFYKKAKEEDEAFADELIAANMMKFYEHGIHNMTISGVDPKTGAEATNDVTYLVLHVLRIFHDSHPRVTVRIGEDTPQELLMLTVRLWADGMCDPSVCSDKLVIESFVNNYGMPIEDARDYSLLGCQEIEIPGRSNFGCEDGALNMSKILEYTMNDGVNRFDEEKRRVGLPTGRITDYSTYEDFEQAFFKQLDYFTKYFCELCNLGAEIRVKNFSKLVKTVCTDDCVKKGMSLDEGGARYNYGCVETAGMACVADSLYAIKKAVFEDKTVTAEELDAAIDANFEGHEETRRILADLPKFGNANDEVDELARHILEHFWAEIAKYTVPARGGEHEYLGACSLLQGGISYGASTWATPDGRFKGEPLGNTIGSVTGRDVNGLTALLGSVSKLNLSRGLGGTTCNVRIPKDTTQTEEDRVKVAALIKAFLLNGGLQAQITTANIEELKDAQINPEKHQNLLVRVGGFSVYFNQLDRASQDEIIKRYGA